MTSETTVYAFAEELASARSVRFVVSDTVPIGEVLIDPQTQTITTSPNRTWTLAMNAGRLLPPNRTQR